MAVYSKNGLALLVPDGFRVRDDAPKFFATGKKGASLIIQVNPPEQERSGWKMLIHDNLAVNPLLISKIIRHGPITDPYPGFEKIVEHTINGKTNSGLGMYLYIEKTFVQIDIGAETPFCDQEITWANIINSIKVF